MRDKFCARSFAVCGSTLALVFMTACGSAELSESSPAPESETASQGYTVEQAAEARFNWVAERLGKQVAERFVLKEARDVPAVHELELDDGSVVAWYELLPGVTYVAQTLNANQKARINPELVRDRSMAELYAILAGRTDVPAAVRELDERRAEFAAIHRELSNLEGPPELDARRFLPKSQQLLDPAEGRSRLLALPNVDDSLCQWEWLFETASCVAGADALQPDWTELHPFYTNFFRRTHEDVYKTWGGGCSYRGTIRYRVQTATWSTFSNLVSVRLNAGQAQVGWGQTDWWYDFDVRTIVDESDGDGFHTCMAGYD